jgi:hypothetical protein
MHRRGMRRLQYKQMRLWIALLSATALFAAGWDDVLRIPAGQTVEITTRDGVRKRGELVSTNAGSVIMREQTGELSTLRAQIRELRVFDPGRRVRKGVMWTAIGAGAGLGIGWGVCPHCSSEGAAYKYVAPGIIIGAALGALGFLSSPHRTVYKSK